MLSVLGVSTFQYAPYAVFNYLTPLATLALAYLGFRAWAAARIGPHGTHLDGDVVALAREVLGARAWQEHLAVFGVFGFLWVAFAYGLHQQYRRGGMRSELLLASGYVFAICAASRLQATDTERVFVMLAPVVAGVVVVVVLIRVLRNR